MNLPTGTVTLFFAAVERGSAALHAKPDSHVPAASLRHALLFAIQAQNGFLLSNDDDSLRASFSKPEEALSAAVAIQQIFHPDRAAIPVPTLSALRRFCIALHTGRVQVAQGEYVGEAVEHTAQLLAAGHSGQILVSAECSQALQGHTPADIKLRSLGKFQYADRMETEAVFQLMHPDLPSEFPPLRLVSGAATNLPIPWTPFVGREAEIKEIKRALLKSRILTLIGSEGMGKSRLAVQLAAEMRSAFPDGVWIVPLPSISDTDLVAGVVGWTLNVQTGPDLAVADALRGRLRDRKALLVLDANDSNLAACARFITAVNDSCPDIKFVVCARMGLGLRDEAIYGVPALATIDKDDKEEGADAEELCRIRASQLPIPQVLDGPTLTELCTLLNGVPLALELAIGGLASRPTDSFFEVLCSLRDRTDGKQHSWEHTLHLALDWSFLRLSDTEQMLLERLSVFQGGWSLEAATTVCCDAFLSADLLPALLESLRACGFIAAEERSEFTREYLRDAVRNYASARLTRGGEAVEYRRRHAEYFTWLAEQGAEGLTGPDPEGFKAYLDREYVNFRAALVSLRLDAEGADHELRLANALLPFLTAIGRAAEGKALIAHATEAKRTSNIQAEEYPISQARFVAAIDFCRSKGDRAREVRNLVGLARLAVSHSDYTTAMQCYEQAIEVYRELGDRAQETRTLHSLGSAARDGGEYAVARNCYERALELNRSLGNRSDEAHNLNGLARLAQLQGDSAEAARRFQEGMLLFRELGESAWEAHNMGQILRLSLPGEPLWEHAPIHERAEK